MIIALPNAAAKYLKYIGRMLPLKKSTVRSSFVTLKSRIGNRHFSLSLIRLPFL